MKRPAGPAHARLLHALDLGVAADLIEFDAHSEQRLARGRVTGMHDQVVVGRQRVGDDFDAHAVITQFPESLHAGLRNH